MEYGSDATYQLWISGVWKRWFAMNNNMLTNVWHVFEFIISVFKEKVVLMSASSAQYVFEMIALAHIRSFFDLYSIFNGSKHPMATHGCEILPLIVCDCILNWFALSICLHAIFIFAFYGNRYLKEVVR